MQDLSSLTREPGIEPTPAAGEAWGSNHWTVRDVSTNVLLETLNIMKDLEWAKEDWIFFQQNPRHYLCLSDHIRF